MTPRAVGQPCPTAETSAMCHALVDTWQGDVGRRIPFVASVATLKLVARVRVDECVSQLDVPSDYARAAATKPWDDGSLPIGSLNACLLASGPLIHVEAGARYEGQTLSFSGFVEALASSVQMGLAVESSMASAVGVSATVRAPHGGPEMLGWTADAVTRALSACGHVGGVQIHARLGAPAA